MYHRHRYIYTLVAIIANSKWHKLLFYKYTHGGRDSCLSESIYIWHVVWCRYR